MLTFSAPSHAIGKNLWSYENRIVAILLIGSLLSPLLLVWIATTYNWRMAFFIAGIPGLAIAAVIARFVREPAPPHSPAKARSVSGLKTVFREILGQRNVRLDGGRLFSCAYQRDPRRDGAVRTQPVCIE